MKLVGKVSQPLEKFRQALKSGQITPVTNEMTLPAVGTMYSRKKDNFHDFQKDLAFSKAPGISYQFHTVSIGTESVKVKVTMAKCGGIKVCGGCNATYPIAKKRCCKTADLKKCGEDCKGFPLLSLFSEPSKCVPKIFFFFSF